MKVKRFVGETAQEAMQKVKTELGRDAIIISSRKVRKSGILGFFSRPIVEVIATIDSDYKQASKKTNAVGKNTPNILTIRENYTPLKLNDNTYNFKAELKSKLGQAVIDSGNISDEKIREALDAIAGKEKKLTVQDQHVMNYDTKKEIDDLKTIVAKIYDAVKDTYEDKHLSESVKKYLDILEMNEVEKSILNEIKEKIIETLDEEKQNSEIIVRNAFTKILNGYFKESQPFAFNENKKVLMFIGPTGVGKTTTLAKLAANMVLTEKKKVGLITSDTYRIAAIEQLKTYSEIIGVPLAIIYSPNEIQKSINSYIDKEIIMVDTAGRSHKDKYQLVELKSLLSSGGNYETYLVISATTKFSDCIDIIKSYNFLDDYKLIFTKLDETNSLGLLLNIAYVTGKSVSYVTTGQSVPDDIEIADNSKIINCLLGERLYERSS